MDEKQKKKKKVQYYYSKFGERKRSYKTYQAEEGERTEEDRTRIEKSFEL